jgi:hypothetical protein
MTNLNPGNAPTPKQESLAAWRGDQDAADLLAVTFDTYDHAEPPAATLFAARRSIAVLFAALDAHPDYVRTAFWWIRSDSEVPNLTLDIPAPWARPLIAWLCEMHPMQVLRIERDSESQHAQARMARLQANGPARRPGR